MAKKLTQKDKLMKSFMFAQRVKNIANRLDFDCEDYGFQTGQQNAKELITLCEEFLKIIK